MAKRRHKKGIPLPKNQKLLMLLFPDEQVTSTIPTRRTTCRKLHINKSNNNTTWFDCICRENKTDGTETTTVRSKIVIDNKIIEKVNLFNC